LVNCRHFIVLLSCFFYAHISKRAIPCHKYKLHDEAIFNRKHVYSNREACQSQRFLFIFRAFFALSLFFFPFHFVFSIFSEEKPVFVSHRIAKAMKKTALQKDFCLIAKHFSKIHFFACLLSESERLSCFEKNEGLFNF